MAPFSDRDSAKQGAAAGLSLPPSHEKAASLEARTWVKERVSLRPPLLSNTTEENGARGRESLGCQNVLVMYIIFNTAKRGKQWLEYGYCMRYWWENIARVFSFHFVLVSVNWEKGPFAHFSLGAEFANACKKNKKSALVQKGTISCAHGCHKAIIRVIFHVVKFRARYVVLHMSPPPPLHIRTHSPSSSFHGILLNCLKRERSFLDLGRKGGGGRESLQIQRMIWTQDRAASWNIHFDRKWISLSPSLRVLGGSISTLAFQLLLGFHLREKHRCPLAKFESWTHCKFKLLQHGDGKFYFFLLVF